MIEIKAPDPSKRMKNAYLHAKATGFLNLANFHLAQWPAQLTTFNDEILEGGKHWEEFDLNKIDLSHNDLDHIDPGISNLHG
jgi:hypothetical protein